MNKSKASKKNKSIYENKKLFISLIAIGIFFLYSKIISFDFIGFDEPTLIFDNYKFIRDIGNIPETFKHHIFDAPNHFNDSKDYYRPFLTISLILDAQFGGKTPTPAFYHFTNIIIHISCSLLLFLLFHRLKVNATGASLLTALFAVHPLLTQAIAWIPGRNDSLVTLFILLSFIFFLKHQEKPAWKYFFLHLLFFTMALYTKENAIMFVFVCFYYLFFIEKRILVMNIEDNGKVFKNFTRKYKQPLIFIPGYSTIIICWFFMRNSALEGNTNGLSISSINESLLRNFPLLIQYIQKSILPLNLSVMSTIKDTNYILGFLSIFLIALGIYFTKQRRWNWMIFGIYWFVVFLLPSLLASYFEGLEHRAYLSIVGLLICISEFDIIKNLELNKFKFGKIGFAVVVLYSIITFMRLPIFKNRLNYWVNAVSTSDNSSLSCLNLGKTYEEMGLYDKAIVAYGEGLKRNGEERMLHNNIGGAYIIQKKYTEAEFELKQELNSHPDNSYAYYNLGLVHKLTGKIEKAVPLWEKTLEHNKDFINAYQQLADYYKQKNDVVNFNRCVKELRKRNL